MYRLMVENHVPFEIVNEAGVQRGEMEQYQVLVIPDAVSLADETVDGIREAVNQGLGVVATHMTGSMDGQARTRKQPALADLFDVRIQDVVAYESRRGRTYDPVLELPETLPAARAG